MAPKWSTIRRELSYRSRRRFYTLVKDTLVTYVRMSATMVLAVVVRLCLDCIGIIATGQNPEAVVFWFAYCQDGQCVFVAFFIFLISLCGASFFAWCCQEWIVDPEINPYAKSLSFKILVDSASWVPISVCVGKTNALVAWCMDITQDDVVQMLLSSAITALLTLCCALLTHVSMTHCRGVAGHTQAKEAGVAGYGKFLILTTLSCLGWAVGWSLWAMVMSFMDALQPGRSVHTTAIVVGVISLSVICATTFYLRYGPEPVIPDPLLQQLCYGHGYSNSVRRAFVSYLVYACMVFLVMCCADPTYGLLHVVANQLKAQLDPSAFDAKALMVLLGICITVTMLATLISAAITRLTRVDMESSMKLSRSAYEVRLRLVQGKRSDAELLGYEQMMRDACGGLDDDLEFLFSREMTAEPESPRCSYSPLEFADSGVGSLSPDDNTSSVMDDLSEPLNRIAISRSLCASVLCYDVLCFVVCTLWGTFSVRSFFVVFGYISSVHSVLYVLSVNVYAFVVAVAVMWACITFFPSADERRLQEADLKFTREGIEVPPADSEPFLEVPDAEETELRAIESESMDYAPP